MAGTSPESDVGHTRAPRRPSVGHYHSSRSPQLERQLLAMARGEARQVGQAEVSYDAHNNICGIHLAVITSLLTEAASLPADGM